MPLIGSTAKIDNQAVNGLAGTYNSLAYRVHELEKHFHNNELIFGNASNTMTADTPVKFTVTGGNNAWGTELLLTDGTVIESGSATKRFDLNELYITDVTAANKVSIVDILYGTLATAVDAVTTTAATDLFTKEGHGLSNGDKIVLSSIVDTTGINAYTVYYVISVAGNDFQVSLTSGGGAVALTNNGSCSFRKLTQSEGTKFVVSMAAVNNDASAFQVKMPRVACNNFLSIRAKSETGQTVGIGFLIGLHVYSA